LCLYFVVIAARAMYLKAVRKTLHAVCILQLANILSGCMRSWEGAMRKKMLAIFIAFSSELLMLTP
jgi:hypothetical protein